MSKKNNAAKAQNENVNVVANNVTEKAVQTPQATAELTDAAKKAAEAKALMEEAKKMAAEAKEAAKKAREAAAAAKAFTSRPKRACYWVAVQAGLSLANYINKSDVHYVAEKAAIDYVAAEREAGRNEKVELYKVNKETKAEVLVSTIYLDENNCIVID